MLYPKERSEGAGVIFLLLIKMVNWRKVLLIREPPLGSSSGWMIFKCHIPGQIRSCTTEVYLIFRFQRRAHMMALVVYAELATSIICVIV